MTFQKNYRRTLYLWERECVLTDFSANMSSINYEQNPCPAGLTEITRLRVEAQVQCGEHHILSIIDVDIDLASDLLLV